MESEKIKTQYIVESSPETIDQLKAEIAALRHANDSLRNAIKDAQKKMETMYELPASPIACAEMLINANYKNDTPDFLKRIGCPREQYINFYTPKSLRQIAEHLLLYCNYNEGDDEILKRNELENKIKTIANHYGYDAQSRKCIEEMAELTQAINKLWRKGLNCGNVDVNDCDAGFVNPVLEEIADVLIMIAQMVYFLRISDEDLKTVVAFKLDRQLERIGKEDGK